MWSKMIHNLLRSNPYFALFWPESKGRRSALYLESAMGAAHVGCFIMGTRSLLLEEEQEDRPYAGIIMDHHHSGSISTPPPSMNEWFQFNLCQLCRRSCNLCPLPSLAIDNTSFRVVKKCYPPPSNRGRYPVLAAQTST